MRRPITPAITAALAAFCLLLPASAAQGATCAGADLQPSSAGLGQMRAATLCLLNAERSRHGLASLRENSLLTAASQAYSQQMVNQQFFAHVTPGGIDLTERLKGIGYVVGNSFWTIGENLAWGTGGMATPARIMQAWMESPGHRENILAADFREVGVGIVLGTPGSRTAPGAATYTTDFGTVGDGDSAAPTAPAARTTTSKRVSRKSCAALRRAKARGKISRAGKKRLARCRRASRAKRR
jgi:uncharacterized protein YkwD